MDVDRALRQQVVPLGDGRAVRRVGVGSIRRLEHMVLEQGGRVGGVAVRRLLPHKHVILRQARGVCGMLVRGIRCRYVSGGAEVRSIGRVGVCGVRPLEIVMLG